MSNWWQNQLAKGKCPACGNRPVEPDKAACTSCLKNHAKAKRKYYHKNRDARRAYNREYMRKRRATNTAPAELIAKAQALEEALRGAVGTH